MSVVNIPSPCPLKLNQLSPVDGGFYCGQCCKVVVDFREKSDAEILSTLENSDKGRVCGVYHDHQVNTGFRPTFQVLRFVASLVLAFGVTLFASCGNEKPKHTMGDSMRNDSVQLLEDMARAKADSLRIGDSIAHIDTGIIVQPKPQQ